MSQITIILHTNNLLVKSSQVVFNKLSVNRSSVTQNDISEQ